MIYSCLMVKEKRKRLIINEFLQINKSFWPETVYKSPKWYFLRDISFLCLIRWTVFLLHRCVYFQMMSTSLAVSAVLTYRYIYALCSCTSAIFCPCQAKASVLPPSHVGLFVVHGASCLHLCHHLSVYLLVSLSLALSWLPSSSFSRCSTIVSSHISILSCLEKYACLRMH